MPRRALIVLVPAPLVALPAIALGALGVVLVASTTAHHGAASFGNPAHFAIRQVLALVVGATLAMAVTVAGPSRLFRAAPLIFVVALLGALAVFVPGVGVRASGANRWLRLGPLSGSPAPFLIAATALLTAAWGAAAPMVDRAHGDGAQTGIDRLPKRPLAVGLCLLAVLALVAEPDFSAAAIMVLVALVGLAGAGVQGRRLVPAALAALLLLGLLASRFGYVGGRVNGFMAPERDRRGKGFEVLTLAHTRAAATARGVGLGHGTARHRLSSPGSDYAFAVVTEELGRVGAGAVIAGWLVIGLGAILAARGQPDPRRRAVALGAGMAVLAPAALHVAVCSGWVPIIGVSMPLLSYDPAATVAAGAELGLIASVALARRDA